MTIEQLQYFHAITEYDTFLDAAESLHISQSSLSKQLKKLEEELGVTLIDRSRRKAVLTEAGRVFADDVRLLLLQYRLTTDHLLPYRKRTCFRIGTLPILGQYELSEKLAQFAAAHPELPVIIEDVEEKELAGGFASGRYDAIICREVSSAFPAAPCAEIARDELVAVLPDHHPLAARTALSVSDLSDQPMIWMNPYTSIHQLCHHLFEQNALTPADIQVSRMETMTSRIQAEQRIGLMPYQNFRLFRPRGLTALPLLPMVVLPILLILRPGQRSSLGESLLSDLR